METLLVVLAAANVVGAFASPLALYVLLRHGPVGGDSRELAAKRLDQEARKLGLLEEQQVLQKEKHTLELEIRRAQLEQQKSHGPGERRLRHVERV